MAIAKTLGIETEYGIVHRGTDEPNPITASSLLINAFLATEGYRPDTRSDVIAWDFIDEHPDMDARGFSPMGAMAPEVETQLVNAVLRNGARYYVDHAHPEMSTPECADPLSVVRYDRAGELIVQRSMMAANELLPSGQELVLYKNNSDGKGNSYGTHENYLVSRDTPFGEIVRHCTAHFITRQIFTGAGKVGAELPGQRTDEVHYQLTQRADFFEEEVGLETTLKRPIINTRDEPHADARKYRRLHVIVGDANPSQVATFLKVGTTALVLALVEDGAIPTDFVFKAPVTSLRHVSHDLSLSEALPLADGTTVTALDVQWELFDLARKHEDDGGFETLGGSGFRRYYADGSRCSPALNAIRWHSRTNLTGSQNIACSMATVSAMDCPGPTRESERWTFSTPTCAPIAVWHGGSASNNLSVTMTLQHRSASRQMTPVRTFAGAACGIFPTPSLLPTGTRSCSTSVATHFAAYP